MITEPTEDKLRDDDSPTDELPVLSEVDIVDDFERTPLSATGDEPTGRHPAIVRAHVTAVPPSEPAAPGETGSAAVPSDGTAPLSVDRLEALQKRIVELAARCAHAAAEIGDKDATIASLEERLTATRNAVQRRDETERRLRADLAERDARLAEADTRLAEADARLAELAAREAAAAARLAELEPLVAEQEALAELEAELVERERRLSEREARPAAEAAPAPAPEPEDGAALKKSREEAAALATYIEGRRAHWHEMETRVAEQRARIDELEREVAQRAAREREAVALAESETRRVRQLKGRVAELTALLDHRAAPPPEPPAPAPDPALSPAERHRLEDRLERLSAELAARDTALKAAGEKLREHADERESLRRRLAESTTQLEQAREAIRRLERILVDRDRSLDAKNLRIEALETQLAGRAERRMPPAPPATGNGKAGRDAARSPRVPALVCLTSDTPREYRLHKPALTIGRSPHCDIQIATHFVSREHARVSLGPGGVTIEDLGSKNGVFVNSVRVEREALEHGDLVTVGETQFRFLSE